jgi:hypothetical protein
MEEIEEMLKSFPDPMEVLELGLREASFPSSSPSASAYQVGDGV